MEVRPPEDEDFDSDWADEPEGQFRTLSVAIAQEMDEDTCTQSWAERSARAQFSWEKLISGLCDAFLAFTRTGPPPTVEVTSSSHSFSILCIGLTG